MEGAGRGIRHMFSTTTLLLLLLLLITTSTEEMGPRAVEARFCESPSQKLKGTTGCGMRFCNDACHTEGFNWGICRGLIRLQCICRMPCRE